MAIFYMLTWLIGCLIIGFVLNFLLVKLTGRVSSTLGNFAIGCAIGPIAIIGGLHPRARAKGESGALLTGGFIGTSAYAYFLGVF
jgi:hypothetical protein